MAAKTRDERERDEGEKKKSTFGRFSIGSVLFITQRLRESLQKKTQEGGGGKRKGGWRTGIGRGGKKDRFGEEKTTTTKKWCRTPTSN
jgi:hypothetical protein